MTPDLATLTFDLASRREFVTEGPIVPVLIRVPALRATSRQRPVVVAASVGRSALGA